MIYLKTDEEIEILRENNILVSRALAEVGKNIRPGVTTRYLDKIAEDFGYDLLARIPMDPKLTALVDKGWIEMMDNDYLESAAEVLVNRTQKKI